MKTEPDTAVDCCGVMEELSPSDILKPRKGVQFSEMSVASCLDDSKRSELKRAWGKESEALVDA